MSDVRVYGSDGQADGPGEPAVASWKTRDIIVAAALAVPLGLVWVYVWGIVWSAGRAFLPELGFFLDGFYLAGGVLVGYVIRKPGAALLGEMIAALVELPLTPFGVVVLWLGFVQGIGAEAGFAATRYRRWGLMTVMVAGLLGALVGWFGYDYWMYGYYKQEIGRQLLLFVIKLIGGALLGGGLGKVIADAVAATGMLNNFAIARGRVREI
jgi:energy-coupling factor transport system substrate-specific component